MDCAGCAHPNPPEAAFCGECGASLAAPLACPGCGRAAEPGQKFCHGCGEPLEAPAADATPERAPRDYTPRHLADRILRTKSALEGERKQVTVLFADVKGSMDLAARLDPEEWHRVLDRFFQLLADGVHRFEGTVNQYTGDGIMALFGAPLAHEDHAHRACYAALHLRDELREFGREVKRRHGLDFAVRIGLNSGEVIVGKIGDDLRMDYTAQGHTVGLAQRMESLASGGSIYVGERTAGLVGAYFDLEDLGEFEVKGAAEGLHVFELRGTGSARTRFDLSRARGLTRFVGRADEMALLEAALERGLAGPGRTVGVVAQAGTGKSRLCYEFVERCRAQGLPVYEARGLAHGKQIPLLPALEIARAFFGIEEGDSERVVREKIAGRALLLDASLTDDLPILFDLLGVPDPARPLPAVDPEEIQRRLQAAIRAVATADSQLEPGVTLLEDMHWVDPASEALFEQVLEGTVAARGLVLLNFRPEYSPRWMRESHYQHLPLMPLSEESQRELLRDLLGEDASVAELPDVIYARTGGNPFFIEEVVQSLVDEGHLAGERGAYRLATPVRELPMPETVQAVLAARIDRLPEREKHVLQAASAIGKTFRQSVLERVVELPERDLADALRRLEDAEFLHEAALYPEREYSFKHPLTQEVADRSQLSERRIRSHAAVARAIEELEAEHLDTQAALLAYHWEKADEPVRAARWYERAAARIGETDYGEAFGHWRRIDALLDESPDDPEVEALRGRTFDQLLGLAFRVGIAEEEASEIVARGRAFHEARGDERGLALLLTGYSTIAQTGGRLAEYSELIREAGEMAHRSGDPAVIAATTLDRCYSAVLQGRLEEALAAADEAVAIADGDAQLGAELVGYSPLVTNLAFGGMALHLMGRLEEAEERFARTAGLTSEDTAAETLNWLNVWRSELELMLGRPDAALRTALRCVELAQRSGSRFDSIMSPCWLGIIHIERGSWRDGLELLESAHARAREMRMALDMVVITSWALPFGHLGTGEPERARAAAEESVASCREQHCHSYLCRSLYARASVALQHGDRDAAAADLNEVERLVDETGARLFLGPAAELRAEVVPAAERDHHLHEAQRLYAEMGARGFAERVVGKLAAAEGTVPEAGTVPA